MSYAWTYRRWGDDATRQSERPLQASDLLASAVGTNRHPPTTDDWLRYMEVAYLSCRILMIASTTVHLEALYCAGHVLERGMKAVMQFRGMTIPSGHKGHDLEGLCNAIGDEFTDPEYVKLCQLLQPFQEAGRYPDHRLVAHAHSLNLLRFLDSFVLHIRELVGKHDGSDSQMAKLKTSSMGANAVEKATLIAMSDQNALRQDLGIPLT
jgi:hypothetical protein